MKKRVLFVDNNKEFLDTYRMVFCRTDEWECYYASDVLGAIDYLHYVEVDIVVTDLTLPLFDGSQILEYVKKQYPSVIRLIYTECQDIEKHLKVVTLAHQFLEKTTEIADIEKTINQLYHLHRIVISNRARNLLGKIDSIPSLPDVFFLLKKEIESHETSVKKVGELISSDVGLSATLLKIINSSYFGLHQHIATPEQAVALLGLDIVEALIVSAHLFSLFTDSGVLPINAIMQHSIAVSRFCKVIAEHQQASQGTIDAITIAAILHDVGRLVLSTSFPKKYQGVLTICESYQRPLSEVEKEVIGVSHSEAGAYILGLWGFPLAVVEAVAFHHSPGTYEGKRPTLLGVLHCADLFAYEMLKCDAQEGVELLDREFLNNHSMLSKIDDWRALCKHNQAKETFA